MAFLGAWCSTCPCLRDSLQGAAVLPSQLTIAKGVVRAVPVGRHVGEVHDRAVGRCVGGGLVGVAHLQQGRHSMGGGVGECILRLMQDGARLLRLGGRGNGLYTSCPKQKGGQTLPVAP